MFVEGKPRTVFFLQTLYFTAFIATVEQIITYALGEHDPGSAQDWRTSNDFCSPEKQIFNFTDEDLGKGYDKLQESVTVTSPTHCRGKATHLNQLFICYKSYRRAAKVFFVDIQHYKLTFCFKHFIGVALQKFLCNKFFICRHP